MSDVKQTIQVTNAGLSPILSIAQGTGMVDFEFTISDFQIPAGSTAVAWNIQPTGNIVSQVCTLAGNVITVTPPAYYFLRGKNYMQIQVTGADGVNLFTFLIEVWCSPNISAPVVSQNPDLISQLMAMIGNTQDLDTTAKNNLVAAINEIYARGVVDILDTEEEIEANTDAGKATGALVTKQLISDLGGLSFGKTTEGEWGYKPEGADSVIPFKSAVLSGANIYNQLWASGGNGSHLNATRYTFAEDYSSVFVVQSSSGIMGYGSESGIAYSGDGTVISLFSKRQSIGTDSSQSYYVDYIENPKTGDTLTFGQATGAQNRAVSIFAFD